VIDWSLKANPMSAVATSKPARTATMVGMVCAGFPFLRLQPDLDQAADRFRNIRKVRLMPPPIVDLADS
jgi:hypothetical protein